MRQRTLVLLPSIVLACAVVASPARADEPRAKHEEKHAEEHDETWGWVILGSGLLVGGAMTTYGLTFDCGHDSRACQREASIAIWGGFGIAAVGSAIGLSIVKAKRESAKVVFGPGGFTLRGSF